MHIKAYITLVVAMSCPAISFAYNLGPSQTVHVKFCDDEKNKISTYCGGPAYIQMVNDGNGGGVGHGGGGAILKSEAATDNNSKISASETSCNPVVMTTGEKIKYESDFAGNGLYGLGLTRIYRSKHAKGTLFGANWLSNLDNPKLTFTNLTTVRSYGGNFQYWKYVVLTHPDGASYRYFGVPVDTDGLTPTVNYQVGTNTASAEAGWLTYDSTSGMYVLFKDNKEYSYDSGGSLQSVYDTITGNNTHFGTLPIASGSFTITGPAGQLLITVNANHRVTQIRDSGGGIWQYFYNTAGMLNKVIGPGTNPLIREYLYENTTSLNSSTLLNGIAINGTRYSRYAYDGLGRVTSSALEGGAKSTTILPMSLGKQPRLTLKVNL